MRYLTSLVAVCMVAGCGGGSGAPDTSSDLPGFVNVSQDTCSEEYYSTLIGKYSGELFIDETNSTGNRGCLWIASFTITGSPIAGLDRCVVGATTSSTVTQSIFLDDDPVNRYQCIDDNAVRIAFEPFDNAGLIIEDFKHDNSLFPVDIDVSNVSASNSGPYFGDESITADYVHLYDSSLRSVVRQITAPGDGTLVMRDSNGHLVGTLFKGPNDE